MVKKTDPSREKMGLETVWGLDHMVRAVGVGDVGRIMEGEQGQES